MKLFRLKLYSTWESITDAAERSKKAQELREARQRITKEYFKRIEPYSEENIIKDSKELFDNKNRGDKGGPKTVKDIQERAKHRKNEAREIFKMEYDKVQEKPKKSPFKLKQEAERLAKEAAAKKEAEKIAADAIKEAKKLKLKKNLKIAGGITLGTAAVAGLGYGAKKMHDSRKEKKANEEVRNSINKKKK